MERGSRGGRIGGGAGGGGEPLAFLEGVGGKSFPDRRDRPWSHRQAGDAETDQDDGEAGVGGRLTADTDRLARRLAGFGATGQQFEQGRLPRVEQLGERAALAVRR